jgi:hypothetical protein
MSADKIASFYDDPIKQACDKSSAAAAERGRNLAASKHIRWRLERWILILAGRFPVIRAFKTRWDGYPALKNADQTMM